MRILGPCSVKKLANVNVRPCVVCCSRKLRQEIADYRGEDPLELWCRYCIVCSRYNVSPEMLASNDFLRSLALLGELRTFCAYVPLPTACIAFRLVSRGKAGATRESSSPSRGGEWVGFKLRTTLGNQNTRQREFLRLFFPLRRFISWLEQNYPSGVSGLRDVLEEATQGLQSHPRYEAYKLDQRYLTLWIKYVSQTRAKPFV
jgi:hypothetical protein